MKVKVGEINRTYHIIDRIKLYTEIISNDLFLFNEIAYENYAPSIFALICQGSVVKLGLRITN